MCGTSLISTIEPDALKRQACAACRWVYYPHAAVTASAVVCLQGKVLLVQRRHQPFPGTWMFPSGFTEYGEHPADAALRELKEETGLHASGVTLLSMFISDDDAREPGHLAIFFKVDRVDGVLANDESENYAAAWFPLESLPPIALKNHALIAKQMLRESLLPISEATGSGLP